MYVCSDQCKNLATTPNLSLSTPVVAGSEYVVMNGVFSWSSVDTLIERLSKHPDAINTTFYLYASLSLQQWDGLGRAHKCVSQHKNDAL